MVFHEGDEGGSGTDAADPQERTAPGGALARRRFLQVVALEVVVGALVLAATRAVVEQSKSIAERYEAESKAGRISSAEAQAKAIAEIKAIR